MRRIYHLVTRPVWEAAPDRSYRAPSLETEGFIHCSHAHQVARSANRYYADATDLLVLHLDAERLSVLLRDELATNGELFPHLYGPLERTMVHAVEPMTRSAEGAWVFNP